MKVSIKFTWYDHVLNSVLKNEQECIIRCKNSRRSREYLNLVILATASFLNSFKISDIDQLSLALIFRSRFILV